MEQQPGPQDKSCLYNRFEVGDDGRPTPKSIIKNAQEGRLRHAYSKSLGYFGTCALCKALLWVDYEIRLKQPDACAGDAPQLPEQRPGA